MSILAPKKILKEIFRTKPSDFKRIGKIMRLDSNEITTPFDSVSFKKILESIDEEEIVAYPELEPLYRKLARSLSINRENVLLFSGSDPAIKSLFEVYVEPGDEVISLTPSYGMFSVYCRMFGAENIAVGYGDDFSLSTESITSSISPQTKLILLANPNHTGTILSTAEIKEILTFALDYQLIVLVDEAYFEFSDQTAISLISDFDNLVVSRTMSKALGIAGLRVGYLASNAENIQNIDKVRATHEITSISAKFAEHLIDHKEISQKTVSSIQKGKRLLRNLMEEIGVQTFDSHTNFLFVMLPGDFDAEVVVQKLKEKNIFIKGPFNEVPIKRMIRVTLGPPEQMRSFFEVFNTVLMNLPNYSS